MTHKQIIKHILREESIPEVISTMKSNRLIYGLKSNEKFLIYLKRELNISSLEYEHILHQIQSTEPMPNTQLLSFINYFEMHDRDVYRKFSARSIIGYSDD